MNRILLAAGGALLLLCVVLSVAINHYRDNAIAYKKQRDKTSSALTLANDTINDMQTRQRDVSALDAKYSGELADAQKTIDQLEHDVAAGRKRLRLNATCTAKGTASATSMDDGSSPRLTDAAERDYFTLRRRIEIVTSQLNGLQQYIREQCLK